MISFRFSSTCRYIVCSHLNQGWSGDAMVLDNLPVPGRPTIYMIVGQMPVAPAVGVGVEHFYSALSFLSSFSLSPGDGPI